MSPGPNSASGVPTPQPGVGDEARQVALRVTRAVRGGRSWNAAWERYGKRLARGSLDRRFAQELASGSVRLRARLDAHLQPHCTRALSTLQPDVLDVLRLGAYQILEMDRVSDWSAVHTSVELVKRSAPRAAGLVNAVLRALLRTAPDAVTPDALAEPLRYASTIGSHPEWLVERWLRRFGADEMLRLCAYDNARPELCLRVNRTRSTREALLAAIRKAVPAAFADVGVRVPGGTFTQVRAWVESGMVSVQDESATLVGIEAAPHPGDTWLDLAAAPGGKSCHLAEQVGAEGRVYAYDVSESKVQRIRDNAQRLGLTNVLAGAGDARGLRVPPADGVLLDAPCSGLGVLSRRPDARWRKQPGDLERLSRVQSELLAHASEHVRPGGVLVYSVCSFEPEETLQVAERFGAARTDFELESGRAPAALRQSTGILYFLPQRHAMDGGFVARWRRRA